MPTGRGLSFFQFILEEVEGGSEAQQVSHVIHRPPYGWSFLPGASLILEHTVGKYPEIQAE